MRVLLVDPMPGAGTLSLSRRKLLRGGLGYPGLGLYTVAALTPAEIEVRVVDECVEDIPLGYSPDLVGILGHVFKRAVHTLGCGLGGAQAEPGAAPQLATRHLWCRAARGRRKG